MRPLALFLIALAAAGCAQPSSTTSSSRTEAGATTPPATASVDYKAPQIIDHLTDETTIFECPTCGMMFDAAGTCSMKCAELVETRVAYVCAAENKPLTHSGKCETCGQEARIDKTRIAAATVPPIVSGN